MKQKNLITIVTDHELTADTIARAIGANEKHEGYYLGNGYAVTWTNGGVIEATFSPSENFVLSTTMNSRQVYAHNFKFAMRDYDELVGYKKTEQDRKQLATIKALWGMSHTVVNAMSPERYGDFDFLNLYYFIAVPVAVRRAWLPILTKGAIRHGVIHGPQNRREYEEWLDNEIYNHLVEKSQEDSEIKGAYVMEEMPVEVAAAQAESIGIEPPEAGAVLTMNKNAMRITDSQPLLNMPLMLLKAAVELDFDHIKTMQTAYALYAKKLISYPMVKQNYIPVEIWRQMIRNRETLRFNRKWGKYVRGKAVSGRHNFDGCMNPYYGFGIVTTGLHPTDLTREEENLYNLIVKRVLEAFTPGRTLRNRKDKERRCRRGQNRRRK